METLTTTDTTTGTACAGVAQAEVQRSRKAQIVVSTITTGSNLSSPDRVGEYAEALAIAECLRNGLVVLRPFGHSHRYDFVIEVQPAKFLRVQCKTGRLRNGAIKFNTCSLNPKTYERRDYRGQVDLFCVVCSEEFYFVPVKDVGLREGVLRVEPTKNGQSVATRPAGQYRLRAVIDRLRYEYGGVDVATA